MAKHLLIVESPTKSKTLAQFLGLGYIVKSSFGHVRDLPKSKLGVDVEHDFQPTYVIPPKARKVITELKKAAAGAEDTILATDEDREGESISWHLAEALGLDPEKTPRIVFHEITKGAIEDALKHPRTIDMDLVNAQQGRRVLDRLVGYELSPFLWKKVARGLSAGRVQSVAVRLIVDREREIEAFKPEEYWTITVLLKPEKEDAFEAHLLAKDGQLIPKLGIKQEQDAKSIVSELSEAEYRVAAIEKKEARRYPAPPFTTSALVQEANRRLRFPSKLTMRVAQELYERGFISYHRTDSVNLSAFFLSDAKKFIAGEFGESYYQFRKHKTKSRLAQEAHEAIRPTDVKRTALDGKTDERLAKLYDLIWRRAVASQMKEALFDATTIDIRARNYTFRATGSVLKFEGFLKVWLSKTDEVLLPEVKKDETLTLLELLPKQHFTEPPPRYSEATLVKTLEAHGIGRPSTYAPIISTIQERRYVEKERSYFKPSDLGKAVADLMVEHFPNVVDVTFTAKMEEDLDRIAQGKTEWVPVVRTFYEPFRTALTKKYEEIPNRPPSAEKTDEKCPNCGSALVIRQSRFGRFYGCSTYPNCAYTRNIVVSTGVVCPTCGEGELVERKTKKGHRTFWSCSRYPACEYATWEKPGKPTMDHDDEDDK